MRKPNAEEFWIARNFYISASLKNGSQWRIGILRRYKNSDSYYRSKKHLSYGRICRGQVFVYLLQVWLSNFIGKSLVNVI